MPVLQAVGSAELLIWQKLKNKSQSPYPNYAHTFVPSVQFLHISISLLDCSNEVLN